MTSLSTTPRSWKFTFGLFSVALAAHLAVGDSADDWNKMKAIVPKGYVCYQTSRPPAIDGQIDDEVWQSARWTEDFVDIEGDRKQKPRFRTRAKMLWDAEYFYVAAELEEPHVWGTLTKRDSVVFQDNDFELFIDPDGDDHEYYELEINAINTCWDLFLPRPYKDGGRADNEWDIQSLRTGVAVQGTLNDSSERDHGWTIEIALPWPALREFAHRPAPPRDGDQWRVNFSRVEWQHELDAGTYKKTPNTLEDNWVWSPQGIIDMHRPERWGYVQFSTAPPGTVRFKPDPTRHGRESLLEIYHHQKAFNEKHGRWATSLDELGLRFPDLTGMSGSPKLTMSDDGFRAQVEIPLSEDETQIWSIRHDSRLRRCGTHDELSDTIEGVLARQAAAWNQGDIDAFMKHYWKSDDLTFSSGGKTTYGWDATKERYKRRYPTRERMGNLSVGAVEVIPLEDSSALVLGRWHLEREPAPIGGNFSLVFRHIDGSWFIIHDHTSQRISSVREPQAVEQPTGGGSNAVDIVIDSVASRKAVEALQQYLAMDGEQGPRLQEQPFAAVALTREDARRGEALLWNNHADHVRRTRAKERYTRNPFPSRIVWKQDDVAHSRFYWLAIPDDTAKARAEVIAVRKDQQIEVEASGVERLVIRVNDSMCDLDQPVVVSSGDQCLFAGKIPRTIAVLSKTLSEYGDPRSVYSGELTVSLPKEADGDLSE